MPHESVAGRPAEVTALPAPRGVVLHLRDDFGTAGYFDPGALLLAQDLATVTPRLPATWWVEPGVTAWLTRELVPALCGRFGVTTVALVGAGVGGHGALRLAFREAKLFPVVAALEAALDLQDYHGRGGALDDLYASRESCRQDSAILSVRPFPVPPHVAFACPPGHPHYRGNDRLREKLRAIGVAHTFLTEDDPRPALATFLGEATRQQARRLV